MTVVAAALAVRAARAADAEQIAAIWNHEARETFATTDTEPRDAAAQRAWLAAHSSAHPVLVAATEPGHVTASHLTATGGQAHGGQFQIAGYAALTAYRPKPAFARTVEDSVYVDRAWRGRGVGRLLLSALLERATGLGHRSVIARITAENVASRRLHEGLGFRLVGVEEEIAVKFGRWVDVAVYQRRL